MGIFKVPCACGCGRKVQRGSNYFLEQSLGLKFGVEVIDAYHQNYLTRIDDLDKRIDVDADLNSIKTIRAQCLKLSDLMLTVAHEGPAGLVLSRSEVERLNWFIIQFIWRMEDLNVPEAASLRAHERMSKPQKMLYETFTSGLK